VQPLKTCPLTSEIKQVEAPWSSGNQFVFDTNFGAQQFVSNCFKFHFTVPLTITLADTVVNADDITEANFMEKLFGGQEDLCYSQNSIMQALQNLSIDINSQNVFNMSNIAETFNMVSPYYARKDVDEWFHASQPDRFQSFDVYSGKSAQTLKFINEIGQTTYTTLDAVNESNIFSSRYQKGYVSRTPQWVWDSSGTVADKKNKLMLSVQCGVISHSLLVLSRIR
jgi:hypothetical protein